MENSSSDPVRHKGQLILIVGPSGAGKDTLLDGAKLEFASDSRLVFAKRMITRPAKDEDNETISMEEFIKRQSDGLFLLSWQAHGLGYGLPISLKEKLDHGCCVVANVSRAILQEAEELGYGVTVIHITASHDLLKARLARRGREEAEDLDHRVNREAPLTIRAARLIEIRNENSPIQGIVEFNQALRQCLNSEEMSG